MRQPVQVLVYPLKTTDCGWEYLLLRRIASRGGFWQGVTGGLEEGEDLVKAAERELLEETGLVPSTLEQIDYSYSFPKKRFERKEGDYETQDSIDAGIERSANHLHSKPG